ncbi:class I SAM-dependent methyltransferase [Lentilactobacillus sp. Marseille-Q4993]|uniref:class I SAM-dependent DNA methyltransferase n=1 Tax=Lentilactobacillus sp. Marseille-Q4993 TaxID=3039492 RepID=UPI0024BC6F13|nr:class I SAM-dependent methyltransferase [Lentilactobacillus sp. Marseille-Q4993]
MIYQAFAEFYDELFDNTLYGKWADYSEARLGNGKQILDLACGTGRFIIEMAKRGYECEGADLSYDMLSLAAQHAEESGVAVGLNQIDITDLSGIEKYSTITCFDDSLCYFVKKRDLEQVFSEVSNHLNEDGKFLFDVISPYQTDEVYPGYMYNYRDDDSAFMWTSYEGEFAPHSVEHDLVFFKYNPDTEAYDAYNELHQERTYNLDEYQQMLAKAGLDLVSVTTDFGNQPFDPKAKRWFFECKKGQ